MGQAILPKLLRSIEKLYPSDYHDASNMPRIRSFLALQLVTIKMQVTG